MALSSLLAALPTDPAWAPPETKDSTLNGVPYAPFSKGDKLGRMADWTAEGKDRERGQRPQYGNRYRGRCGELCCAYEKRTDIVYLQTNKFMELAKQVFSQ